MVQDGIRTRTVFGLEPREKKNPDCTIPDNFRRFNKVDSALVD